ncbi:MAG: hypothetical protein V3V32_04520 [Dehalococcoidia bacterium]
MTGRYPFIPPRKRQPYRSVRPLTLVEQLDADGYRYRGIVDGKSVEVFSVPGEGGETYELGNVVAARIVSGSSELFLPAPYALARLFIWPGNGAAGFARLYEYDGGGGAPVQVWIAPFENGQTYISWVGYFAGNLIVCTVDTSNLDLVAGVKLYSLNMSSIPFVGTDLGFAATLNPGGDSDFNFVHDGAEFAVDSCLYMVAYSDDGVTTATRVLQYNPTAGTLILADTMPGFANWSPSIAVYNDTKLIWQDGYVARESVNGTVWANNFDFSAAPNNSYDQGALRTNPAESPKRVYLAGNQAVGQSVVWETPNGVGWNANILGAFAGSDYANALGLHFLSSASEPDFLYAGEWAWGAAQSPNIFRRAADGGAWGLDYAGPGVAWELPAPEAMASIAQNMVTVFVDRAGSRTTVYERPPAGPWAGVTTWNAMTHIAAFVMTHGAGCIRASRSLGCHEV